MAVPILIMIEQRPVLAFNNIIYYQQAQRNAWGMGSWKTTGTI
jgi:hypothetical protein